MNNRIFPGNVFVHRFRGCNPVATPEWRSNGRNYAVTIVSVERTGNVGLHVRWLLTCSEGEQAVTTVNELRGDHLFEVFTDDVWAKL